MPELHGWISKLSARHLHACPPGDLLITMIKETVILYKKEFRKMKKKSRFRTRQQPHDTGEYRRSVVLYCGNAQTPNRGQQSYKEQS